MKRTGRSSEPAPRAGVLVWAAARIVVGALFAFSGFAELIEPPGNFLYVVQSYRILPPAAERTASVFVPWAELLAGVFLALGLRRREAAGLLWALNTVFIITVAAAIIRKLPIKDCGCFGGLFSLPPGAVLTLDLALWGMLGALALKAASDAWGLDRTLGRQ